MKRIPFKGVIRTWLGDIGSANFIISGVLFAIIAGLELVLLEDQGNFFALMYGLTIISTGAAIAWQLIRLRATEWQILTPGFEERIRFQSGFLYILVIAIGYSLSLIYFEKNTVAILMVATVFTHLLILLCQTKPHLFQTIFVFYVLHVFSNVIANTLPLVLLISLVILTGWLVIFMSRKAGWSVDAMNVYRSGLGSSGIVLPNFNFKWLAAFERYFFPANYFIGSVLSNMLILVSVAAILLVCSSLYMGWDIPVLFVTLQVSIVIGSLVHWGRLQKPQALEMLHILPIHNGRDELRETFAHSQRKVAIMISVLMACVALIESVFGGNLPFVSVIHAFFVSYAATLFILGFGSMAKRMWHYTLSMLPAMLIGVWAVLVYEYIQDEPTAVVPIVINIIAVVIAESVFRYSQHKLWEHS